MSNRVKIPAKRAGRAKARRLTLTLASKEIIEEAKKSAWKPYQELARHGVPSRALDMFMLQILFRQAASARTDWDELKGIKVHTLRRFPRRVREFAKQIEALNTNAILAPVHLLFPEREQKTGRNLLHEKREGAFDRVKFAYQFEDLPRIMGEYADFLEFTIGLVGTIRRHPYNPLHHCLVAFTEFVRQTTNDFLYTVIADLATAVISITGEQTDIDPDNLAKLYRNNPHLRSGIRFD